MPFSGLYPLGLMKKKSFINPVLPFYHVVSDVSPAHIRHLYPVKDIQSFKKDINFLLKHFKILSPEDIIGNKIKPGGKPGMILSFDDGLREVKEIIAPLLKEMGLNAIFFLNNNFINNKDLFFRYKASLLVDELMKQNLGAEQVKRMVKIFNSGPIPTVKIPDKILSVDYHSRKLLDDIADVLSIDFHHFLLNHQPYLNDREINELLKDGFFIGAHSLDHPLFSELSKEKQYEQVKKSMDGIQSAFGINYRFFAFPFTHTGADMEYLLGKDLILDAIFGTSGMKKSEFPDLYQRIPMEKFNCSAEKIIRTEYLYYSLKKFFLS